MRRIVVALMLGLMIVGVGGWLILGRDSATPPQEGVLDVWATWADDPASLEAIFDRYSTSRGLPLRVNTKLRSDDLLQALGSGEPPDMVILSSNDLVAAYYEQGLIEALDPWIESKGIDRDDIYPAPLAQCVSPDGTTLCLPWGCDVDALFWNKDLFAAAGLDPERPSQTMEELVAYANKLTIYDKEDELVQVGFIPDFPRSHVNLFTAMYGGALPGAELTVSGKPLIEALQWQAQFYSIYAPEDLNGFVSSFTPYMTSRHAMVAGRRQSCQQCHRAAPLENKKTPDSGFHHGQIAMMLDGEWQVNTVALSAETSQVNYGVAPFPPPSAYPERRGTAMLRGPVVIIPGDAMDKESAADLLAWMMSPRVLAEAAQASAMLPTSRSAAQDPRFPADPDVEVFMNLVSHPNAQAITSMPVNPDLNQALEKVETQVLRNGADPAPLLNELQSEFAP